MNRLVFVAALALSAHTAGAQAVTVKLSEWKMVLSRDTVRAGAVSFRLVNEGAVAHSFFVLGEGVSKGTKDIAAKQSATLTVNLKPGTYEVYCPMSDESHKLAGMKGTLVVLPAEPAPPAKP
jgi:plastocyanin